jgi:hypothetical protein
MLRSMRAKRGCTRCVQRFHAAGKHRIRRTFDPHRASGTKLRHGPLCTGTGDIVERPEQAGIKRHAAALAFPSRPPRHAKAQKVYLGWPGAPCKQAPGLGR